MRLENFMINENMVDKAKSLLKRLPTKQVHKFLKENFDDFVEAAMETGLETQVVSILNKGFDTKYSSLAQIQRMKLREGVELNEDVGHWWELFKSEAFPTLAFYPALTVWLELDKLFQGQDINMTKVVVYALFWFLLVSGKYVKGWLRWKKENPDEYAAERATGKGGIL